MTHPVRDGGPAQRFLLSGMPKSGTTFVQMMLDAHPAINCPGESHLPTLRGLLRQAASTYEDALRFFDDMIARQGIRFDRDRFVSQMLAGGIDALMRADAPWPTTHVGLKDNQVLGDFALYRTFLPDVQFVFVVRDPREANLSLGHHKRRTEPDFAREPCSLSEIVQANRQADDLGAGLETTKLRSFRHDRTLQNRLARLKPVCFDSTN